MFELASLATSSSHVEARWKIAAASKFDQLHMASDVKTRDSESANWATGSCINSFRRSWRNMSLW